MNKRPEHFVSEMRECGLLHETNPNLPFSKLESSLYEDCESSLPLKFNGVDDAPLTNLEEVFDPSLTSLPFVAPSFSSTPIDTSVSDSILLASPLPLAQCTGLEMDEVSRGDASDIEDDSLSWSKELTLVDSHFKEAHFVEFCGDIVMGSDNPSIKHTDPIYSKLFDSTPISSPFSSIAPSYAHAFHESLCDIRGYNPSFDLYCAYLEDVPRKIMRSTFFDYAFHFSMVFDEFKRLLILFAPTFLVFSYSHHSEMNATTYDKLVRALRTSEWSDLSLMRGVADAPRASYTPF